MAVPVRSASMPADLDVPSLAIRRRPTPRKIDPDIPSSISPRLKRASPSSSFDRSAPLSPSSDDIAANYSKLIAAELIPSSVPIMVEDESATQSAVWIGDASIEPPAYISAILPTVAPTELTRHYFPSVSLGGVEYQMFDHVEVRIASGNGVDHLTPPGASNPLRSSMMHSPSNVEAGIARIVAMFEEVSGRRFVFLEWYYRKSDVLSHLLAMKSYEEVVRNPPSSPSGSISSLSGEEEKVRTPRRGRPPKKRRGNIEESLALLETTLDHEIFNAPKPHYTLVPLGAIAAPCFVEHIPLHLSASAAAAAAAAAAASDLSPASEPPKESDDGGLNDPHRYIYRRTYEYKTCYLPGCKARSNVTAPTLSQTAGSTSAFHPALHQIVNQPLSARSSGSSGSAVTTPMPTPPSVSSLARSAPSIQANLPTNNYGTVGTMSFSAVPYLHHLPSATGVSSPRNPHSPHTPHSPHPIGSFYGNESATSSPRTPVTGMEALFPFTPTASPRRGFMQLSASSPALPSGGWEGDEFATMSPRTKLRKTFEVDQQTIHYRSSMTPQPTPTSHSSQQHTQHGSQTHQLPLQYHSGAPSAHYGNSSYNLSHSSDDLYSPRYHHHVMNTRVTTLSGSAGSHSMGYAHQPATHAPAPQGHSGWSSSMQTSSAPNYQAYPDSNMAHDGAGGWNMPGQIASSNFVRPMNDQCYNPHGEMQDHDVPRSISPAFLAPSTLPHMTQQHHGGVQPPPSSQSPHQHAYGSMHAPTSHYSSGNHSQIASSQGYMSNSYGPPGSSLDHPSAMNGSAMNHHHQQQHHMHQPTHHGHYSSNGHYGASFNSDPSQSYPGSTLDHDGLAGIVPTFQLKVDEQDDPSMLGDMVAGVDDFSAPNSNDALVAGGSVSSALSFASLPPRSTSPGLGVDFRTTPPPSSISPPPSELDPRFH